MNKTAIKNYAVWARKELIERVTIKAFEYEVIKDGTLNSNLDIINGKPLTNNEKKQREQLIKEINEKGFDQVMEEVAYTWFNRFIALRFMEVNNYLPKRVRIFTNENNEFKPQILDEALNVEFEELDKEIVFNLIEKNNEDELYKQLIIATCNEMGNYLPGLFSKISDYKVLLFPNNILRKDSIIGKMVNEIEVDSWLNQVEIIGWMYQFYIQTPKDELIHAKKQYKSNEIGFVTQLFTPKWIVKYLVENTLGSYWHKYNYKTDLINKLYYYTYPTNKRFESKNINVEDIKVIDIAMGSGHILVYVFDVLMKIYENMGWSQRDAAVSILQNNIFGLDIDERAYQLTYFALFMKARQYNRSIFKKNIKLNIECFISTKHVNLKIIDYFGDKATLAQKLYENYYYASELGSLLFPVLEKEEIESLSEKLFNIYEKSLYGDIIERIECEEIYKIFSKLLKQEEILLNKYDLLITNPPYMNWSLMTDSIKDFLSENYEKYKNDLFSAFIYKATNMMTCSGYVGMLTPYVWMSNSSYKNLRKYLLDKTSINSLVQLEYNAFEAACVPVVAFTLSLSNYNENGVYVKLSDFPGSENQEPRYLEAINSNTCQYKFEKSKNYFLRLPDNPIAYWISDAVMKNYGKLYLDDCAVFCKGMDTGDNNRFIRRWFEVVPNSFKWKFYNKGGEYRKWYGNLNYVINWENDGYEVKQFKKSNIRNKDKYFVPGYTWSLLNPKNFGLRYLPHGSIFDGNGCMLFPKKNYEQYIFSLLNSKVFLHIASFMHSNMAWVIGDLKAFPIINSEMNFEEINEKCLNLSKQDWDSFETSWDFTVHPLVKNKVNTISKAYSLWNTECSERFNKLKTNEEELNRIFIDIYGLQDELDPYVEDKDVTVRKADLVRDIKSFISYAVGCMFGRYSLDVEGLAYAGGEWDNSKYTSFIPDKDNIITICDDEYDDNDIVGRFVKFVETVYGKDTLKENLSFIADALGGKGTSKEVIRNYFLNEFYKDHCKIYQKRPIYWLFDSGKKNGFKALIYLHRYQPDLIARMRTQYVFEQQSRYKNQIEMIETQLNDDITSFERVRLNKKYKVLKEQDDELRKYEEVVHHYADQMISIDLDDGVKVNYDKFKDLLAKVK